MKTLWVLLVIFGHSGLTVPGIASQEECERLFSEMNTLGWVKTSQISATHSCLAYKGGKSDGP